MRQLLSLRVLFAGSILLLAGFGAGWYAQRHLAASPETYRGTVLRQGGFTFIDPILACEIGPESAFPEFAPTQENVQKVIDTEKQYGKVEEISVYVRSMKSGRWFEIGEQYSYAPASLLKVMILVAYYKEAETTENLLSKILILKKGTPEEKGTPGEEIPHLQYGKGYPIEDLLRQMIVYSDNDAMATLVDGMDNATLKALQGIYHDLNIPYPASISENRMDFMPVHSYAMMFRVLFGATYLTRELSEKVLALLADAHYEDGIVAGVPAGTPVAHKFGIRKEGTTAELHDCGIVYYPDHPYLLCVMTRGSDFAGLEQSVRDISKTAYEGLSTFYKTLPAASSTPVGR